MRKLTSLLIFGFLLLAGPSSAQLSSAGAGCAVNCSGGNGIFTLTNIGTNGAASPSIGSVTVPGGATVIVEVTDQGTTFGSVSDGHNTYTLVKSVNLNNSGASGTLAIFASQNVAALSGATLSYTPHGTSANMSAVYVTAPLGTVAIDTAATASNFGNSTSPTITSGAPTNAGELFLAGVAQTSNSSIAQAPGWVTPFNSVTTENPPLFGGSQTNPGTSASTFTPGGGTSNPWGTVVTAVFSSCSQATAFLSRLDGGENSTAISTLICGMVADGTFQLLDGFDLFATNSTANALKTLIAAAADPTPNGSCTFNANQGYTGDGSSCWFSTGFIPSSFGGNMTLNSASFGLCIFNSRAALSNSVDFGVTDGGTDYIYFNPRISSNFTSFELNGNSFGGGATSTSSQGSWAVTRTSNTTTNLYKNGSLVVANSDPSTSLSTHPISILAFNNNGTEVTFSINQIGAVFWGGGLTATQVTNVYNRLHTYFTTVGAPSGCWLFIIIPFYRRRRC